MSISKTLADANGTEKVAVQWILKNGTTQTASGIVFQNTTTDQSLSWANDLAPNTWLRMDGETGKCHTSTDSGSNWTLANVNTTGYPPGLQCGTTNTLVLTGFTASASLSLYYAYDPRSQ